MNGLMITIIHSLIVDNEIHKNRYHYDSYGPNNFLTETNVYYIIYYIQLLIKKIHDIEKKIIQIEMKIF